MSDADGYFTRGGAPADRVELDQSVELHDIGALVTVELAVDGDAAMEASVVDSFPDDGSVLDARYVPEYQPDIGTINGRRARFAATIDPDESVVVKYGLRLEDPDRASAVISPRIEHAAPIDRGMADFGTNDEQDAPPDDNPDDTDHEDEPAFGPEPPAEPDWAPDAEDDPEDTAVRSTDDGVLARLIAELEATELTDHERAPLRDALELEHPDSVDVQLQHLQSRVAQYDAFAETVESFIDSYGSPEDVAGTVVAQLDRLDRRIAEIEDAMGTATEERENVTQRLEAGEAAIDALEGRIDGLEREVAADIEGIRAEVEETTRELRDWVDEEVDSLSEDVEATVEREVDARLAEVVEDLEGIERRLADAEASFESSIESLREAVEENAAGREQFETFLETVRSLDPETDDNVDFEPAADSATADAAETVSEP